MPLLTDVPAEDVTGVEASMAADENGAGADDESLGAAEEDDDEDEDEEEMEAVFMGEGDFAGVDDILHPIHPLVSPFSPKREKKVRNPKK